MEQYLYSALQFNPSTQEQKKIPSLILEGETNSFFFWFFKLNMQSFLLWKQFITYMYSIPV